MIRKLKIHLLLAAVALTGASAAFAEPPPRAEATSLLARLYPDHLPVFQAGAEIPALSTATLAAAIPAADAPPTTPTLVMAETPTTAAALIVVSAPAVPIEAMAPESPKVASLGELTGAMLVNPSNPATRTPTNTAKIHDPAVAHVNYDEAAELVSKLNIDARRARFIIEFRRAYGPFKTIEDLAQVNGITDSMLEDWETRNAVALD